MIINSCVKFLKVLAGWWSWSHRFCWMCLPHLSPESAQDGNKVSFLLSNLRSMLTLHLRLSHYNYLAVTYHYFVNPGAEPHSGPTISCTTVLQPNLPKHFYIFTIQPSPNSKKKYLLYNIEKWCEWKYTSMCSFYWNSVLISILGSVCLLSTRPGKCVTNYLNKIKISGAFGVQDKVKN